MALPILKLSTAQKKCAHPWRHASQRIKKITPTDGMTWHVYFERNRLNFKPQADAQDFEHKNYYDDWLRARWDAFQERCTSATAARKGLTEFELGMLIYKKMRASMYNSYMVYRMIPMVYRSLVNLDKNPRRATFFIDAMGEMATVRQHITVPPTHQNARHHAFTDHEAAIAFSFRRELCVLKDADYDHVIEHARQRFGTYDEAFDMFLSLVFPDETAWGNLLVERIVAAHKASDDTFYGTMAPIHALASGADLAHMLQLHDLELLRSQGSWSSPNWDCLLDLIITHDDGALPIIIGLLHAHDDGPSLNESALTSISLMSDAPELLIALTKRMLDTYLSSKNHHKMMAHLAKSPDVMGEHLPHILQSYGDAHGDIKDEQYVALKSLLERLESEARALELEQDTSREYVTLDDIPEALTQLPWHQKKGKKPPKLPVFWRPLTYPDLLVKQNPALHLPKSLYDDIGRIMMTHDDDAIAPLIDVLRDWIDETALSQFCWHTVKDWMEANSPAKHMWVFDVFLKLGADDLVRELPTIIDFWIGSKFHKRGRQVMDRLEPNLNPYLYEALDAMMHGAYSDGAGLARQRLEHFARAHFNKTPNVPDFLDALSPRLGLSDTRQLELDSHTHIEVVLDDDLEPRLRSAEGGDVTLAPTIQLKWERLQSRQAQLTQSMARRIEHALITQRRWSAARWRTHVLGHPLLSSVAQRMIWGVFTRSGKLLECWRIDESRDFVNAEDAVLDIERVLKRGQIGLVHPIHLEPEVRQKWLGVCADYEIIQPVEQLNRACYPEVIAHEDWLALYGKSTTHERLHEMFMRHRWQASPVIYMTPIIPGYKIALKLSDGKLTDKEFKFVLEEGIHKDTNRRVAHFELQKCVNLKRLPWEKLDPIDRSELYRSLVITFCDEAPT